MLKHLLLVALFVTSSFAQTLAVGTYLDPRAPNPTTGQAVKSGYLNVVIAGGPTWLNGPRVALCADFDHTTNGTPTLTGYFAVPTTDDEIVAALIYIGYQSAGINTPTNPGVHAAAWAVWKAKTGAGAPDVLGSHALEASYRNMLTVPALRTYYSWYVSQHTRIFTPSNYQPIPQAGDQRFIVGNTNP